MFGSSKCREGNAGYETAYALGRGIAEQGGVVVNGGYGGVMEASAKGAKSRNGRTIGITTKEFKSTCNKFIDEERKVNSWQERVFALMSTADAYVILDGGTGTLVEFSVVVEMMSKKLIPRKPAIIYGPFWRSVKDILERNSEIKLGFIETAGTVDEMIRFLFKNSAHDIKTK